jgi:hypothetical protein
MVPTKEEAAVTAGLVATGGGGEGINVPGLERSWGHSADRLLVPHTLPCSDFPD